MPFSVCMATSKHLAAPDVQCGNEDYEKGVLVKEQWNSRNQSHGVTHLLSEATLHSHFIIVVWFSMTTTNQRRPDAYG